MTGLARVGPVAPHRSSESSPLQSVTGDDVRDSSDDPQHQLEPATDTRWRQRPCSYARAR
jgi:hypothetical protein